MNRPTLVAMPLLASFALLAGAKGLDGRTAGGIAAPSAVPMPGLVEEASDAWRMRRDRALEARPDLGHDPTSMLVQFAEHDLPEWEALLRALYASDEIESWQAMPGLLHLTCNRDAADAAAAIEALGVSMGVVEFAEPDLIYRLGATPNDTSYGMLWGLNNTGQTVNRDRGTANADIDCNLAWDVTTGSTALAVGMCDSGIRATHEDIAGNLWTNPGEIAGNGIDDDGNGFKDDTWGWDFWNNDNNPTDDNGHGTHTAGTVGARGNNAKGVTGVCWNTRMVGLKIGSATGSVSVSAAISALNYCVAKGIKLSNHSWGGGTYSSAMDSAITSARNAGHLLVCSAGNSGLNNDTSPSYPASYSQDNIISVAATDNDNRLASFSNYGATRVDLGAPGVTVYSTYGKSNTSYSYLSGTSMAAPHVTGVAALVWGANPSWSYSQVRSKILSTVKPISALSGKTVTGGLLNANSAVR
jgi:subtilisin family serine protease